MQDFRWRIPHSFSARLTQGLKLDTVVWLLRCSVLRGTPMAPAKNIQCRKAKVLHFSVLYGRKAEKVKGSGEWR
jgi:hypothetical protein